ncbi:MAG TPA: pyridoxal phosphate-dependent aminotransferase [Methanomicrobia archaeon]|nr:pyridoxal phosphate-dependent aminotransferase [Methanomicrobia archaeon]
MELADFRISGYGTASCAPSPVNRMMAAFAADFRPAKDVNLGVGYVNERTIPHELMVEAMQAVLTEPEKYKVPFNYGGSQGSQNLIESLKQFQIEHGLGGLTQEIVDRTEVIIGPNGATSLLEGIAHVVAPGMVITSDPMYYIYCNYLERQGFEVLTVPEDDYGIRTDLLRAKLDHLGDRKGEIAFFYIVTINNPTSTILSNERRAELVQIVTDLSHQFGRKIPLFFDTAYELLVHDPTVPLLDSGLLYDSAGLVYEVGTLSKILAPALRIGYMMGPPGRFMSAMIQKTSDVGFSAPLINQEIASYLLDHHGQQQIEAVQAGYRKKARAVGGWLNEQLGDLVENCSGGKASFYYYLTMKGIQTTETSAFFTYLARTTGDIGIDGPAADKKPRVIYVPGEHCVHPCGDLVAVGKRQLRLSYGFEELDRIEGAIKLMREAAEYARGRG